MATSAAPVISPKPAKSSIKRPNIVLLMSNDHGYVDCSYTGQPERVASMRTALEIWQNLVLSNWAGKDYKPRASP